MGDLPQLTPSYTTCWDSTEPEWLEWKSTLDLSKGSDGLMIAKEILGLANRPPERARLHCEGVGYVVVGAAGGNVLQGVAAVDLATVQQIIDGYVGSGTEAPSFAMQYHSIDGKNVCMVTVEAPRPGDAIFALHKSGQLRGGAQYDNGTVFVRRGSSTMRATAPDLQALQRRLLAVGRSDSPELQVTVTGDVPLSWFNLDAVRAAITKGIEVLAEEMTAAARAFEVANSPPLPRAGLAVPFLPILSAVQAQQQHLAKVAANLASISLERRSLGEFLDQVDHWKQAATRASLKRFERLYSEKGFGRCGVAVANAGTRFLEAVRVELTFDTDGIRLCDELPEKVYLPAEPREYGKPSNLFASSLSPYVPSPAFHIAGLFANRVSPAQVTGSTVSFSLGDVRQGGASRSAAAFLILESRPASGSVAVSWTASARNADGITSGVDVVAAAKEPVDHSDLVREAISWETD